MTTKTERRIHEGTTEVCTRRVSYWYDLDTLPLSDDLTRVLDAEAEERAQAMVSEGYVAGELNCLFLNDAKRDFRGRFSSYDNEVRGWFTIEND